MKKNPLSDIYTNNVLLREGKDNVVANSKELDSKIDAKKAHLVKDQGVAKSKKNVEDPEELKKYSNGEKAKEVKENVNMSNEPKKAFEGSFEKLFKATINEEVNEELGDEELGLGEVDVPTTDDGMIDELEGEKDEVSDLASDLKSVIDHLSSILDKLSGGRDQSEEDEGSEEGHEAEEEEGKGSEEEPFEEAVEADVEGHALVDAKKLEKGFVGPKGKYEVKGAVKVSKGKANGSTTGPDEDLKPAKSFDKALQNTKKQEAKSTVKVGDFFK
jgi:hypothetical protein